MHLLGRGEIVEGFLGRTKSNCFCRHYWARVDGVDYDIGGAITKRLAPQTELLGKAVLLDRAPYSGEQRDDPRTLAVLERGYRTYKSEPAALLCCAPKWIRSEFGF